jgi:hypothetical protein
MRLRFQLFTTNALFPRTMNNRSSDKYVKKYKRENIFYFDSKFSIHNSDVMEHSCVQIWNQIIRINLESYFSFISIILLTSIII